MALQVFPSFQGLGYPFVRKRIQAAYIQESFSGKETRVQGPIWPRYQWTATYDALRADTTNLEFQNMMAFLGLIQGQYQPFYFSDPFDNAVNGQPLGTGDGVNTVFQAVRSIGGYAELIQNVRVVSSIAVNGVGVTATVGPTGAFTLAVAPAAGALVTGIFTYYWLCRLDQDTVEFANIVGSWYELKSLTFKSILL
jgi:uncharacterized protein (TIGR02217 family)